MSAVIDDDDLLHEILLRLGRSTYLVRAAAVSKRWLRLASESAFLRRFRARNPPRLLGFFLHDDHSCCTPRTEFVPASAPPGRGASFARRVVRRRLFDCRNGRVLVDIGEKPDDSLAVRYPLCPTRAFNPLPPLPPTDSLHTSIVHACFLPQGGGDGIVFVALPMPAQMTFSVQASVLRSGAWGDAILATSELPASHPTVMHIMHAHGNVYMMTDIGCILRLDLGTARLSAMKLPSQLDTNFRLAYKEDSRLFLVNVNDVNGCELNLWCNESDGDGADDWVLVDTIRVRAACDPFQEVFVVSVGDDAEFVLLGLRRSHAIICVDLRSQEETVYQTEMHFMRASIYPLTTVWPPVFPALDEAHGASH